MEMLVVLAVFSTFVIMATDLFLTVNRVQRETQVSERVLSENRSILETIAQEVRQSRVDYKAYGDPANPADAIVSPVGELKLLSAAAEKVLIKKDSTFCPSALSTPCVVVSRDNGVSWASMTPKGIRVIDMKFIVSPALDPFYFNGTDYLSSEQPLVTVILNLESTDEMGKKHAQVSNQTSIAVRAYER